MGLCSQQMIRATLNKRHNAAFCRLAGTSVPNAQSYPRSATCRPSVTSTLVLAVFLTLSLALFPNFFLIITLWAGSFLLGSRLLKGSAALANLIRILVDAAKPTAQLRLSILIALYRETEMVDQLIGQIRHLTCPASQLEVFLLAEQSDTKPTLH